LFVLHGGIHQLLSNRIKLSCFLLEAPSTGLAGMGIPGGGPLEAPEKSPGGRAKFPGGRVKFPGGPFVAPLGTDASGATGASGS